MACYLCAYQRVQTPSTAQPLPTGSPAAAASELATCWRCSVWACSAHGTRYGQFECAMCTPATAAVHAVTGSAGAAGGPPSGSGVGGAAVARARIAGLAASPQLHDRMRAALSQIANDHHAARERTPVPPDHPMSRFAPYVEEPNLVSNLADVVRQYDIGPIVPSVRGLGFTSGIGGHPFADGLSLDAVSAAVWDLFAEANTMRTDDDAVVTATGAYLLAVAVADVEAGSTLAEPTALRETSELPAPWELSHPVLLDPALWLVGTALRAASR